MKVLLHDPGAGLYFRNLHDWTRELKDALDLQNLDEALELANGTGRKDCEVILTWDGPMAMRSPRPQTRGGD